MDPMTGLAIGSTVLGGLGGKNEAKRSRQPTTSRTTAYRPGDVDWFLDQARGFVEGYDSPGRQYSENMWGVLQNNLPGRGGAGAPGGGGAGGPAAGGAGGRRGGRGRGGGGRGGGKGGEKQFARFLQGLQADPNEFLRPVLEGEYLSLDSNPYLQERIDLMQGESAEDLERGLGMMAAQASGFGRTGSGSAALQEALAFEESQEALDAARAGMLGESYENERNRMMQGLGFLSEETMGLRGNLTDVRQSNIAAQAQKASARIQANASMYGADRAYQAAMANNSRLSQEADRAYELGMFDRAMQLDNAAQAEAMAGMELLGAYGRATQPFQLGLGTTTQQGPGVSDAGGFFQGGFGGAMQGLGLGMQMQDAGFFGGGGNPWDDFNSLDFAPGGDYY